jgi:hypothetical protein
VWGWGWGVRLSGRKVGVGVDLKKGLGRLRHTINHHPYQTTIVIMHLLLYPLHTLLYHLNLPQ